MDLNLKQWRCQQQYESGLQQPTAKLPRFLDLQLPEQQREHSTASSALPLFVPDSASSARFPKMGSSFSLAQWHELELQALIFRHMLAGVAVPSELLRLLKKTLLNTTSSSNFYLQPYPHCYPALFQSGYWGRGSMDLEPGRCRRTDGKKWRCSRDVVAGHKYCERHMHRGRNRSRKPVEPLKPNTTQPPLAGPGGGLTRTRTPTPTHTPFDLSGSSPSVDLLHLNPRSTDSRTDTRATFEAQTEVPGLGQPNSRVLRQFFDDKPVASSTSLSISTPGNLASDFSLKLSTGNGDGPGLEEGNAGRDRAQLHWAGGWGPGPVPQVGGPLGEALRSSASNSSPTSVLHQLPPPGSTSETSFVST
ncbi:hypothetical protein NMG60_11001415 [Bertholletia excelsa]